MSKFKEPNHSTGPKNGSGLFQRVALILEQARSNVARAVNSNMVLAYWLIGREIVDELQQGRERAEYGRQLLDNLSAELTKRYGKGFSVTNLKNFRTFYLSYPNRLDSIRHPPGDESINYRANGWLKRRGDIPVPHL